MAPKSCSASPRGRGALWVFRGNGDKTDGGPRLDPLAKVRLCVVATQLVPLCWKTSNTDGVSPPIYKTFDDVAPHGLDLTWPLVRLPGMGVVIIFLEI
jgi:hypothetical protein